MTVAERAVAWVALLLVLTACGAATETPATGEGLAREIGCLSCHTDTSTQLAPTLHGLAGTEVRLEDGSTVVADSEYIRRSIADPGAQIVEGYRPAMPRFDLTAEEIDRLVEYVEGLGS
ncbi:MAG TPA: c-type cytochrome [Acidimicrobiia bacterium]|nr:c-type cytochrome [Acidimicrobiia bacterium]